MVAPIMEETGRLARGVRSALFHTLVYTALAFVFLGGARLAYSLLVGRGLGAEALGQANVLLSLTATVGLLVSTFTQASALKFTAEHRGRGDAGLVGSTIRQLTTWSLAGGLVLMALLALATPWLADAFNVAREELAWALPLVPLSVVYAVFRGILLGLGRVRLYALLEGLSSVLLIGATVVMTLRGDGALMLPFLLGYAVFALAGLPEVVRRWGPRADRATRRELLRYGGISLAGTLAAALRGQGAILVAGLVAAGQAVGYFSAGFTIVSTVLFLPAVMVTSLTPVVAFEQGQGRTAEVRRLLEAGLDYAALLAALTIAPLILMAFFVLQFLYGPAFAFGAAPTLRILLASVFVTMVTPAAISVLSATEHVRVPNAAGLVGLLASVFTWILLLPARGIEGVAWGYLAGTLLTHAYIILQARRLFRIALFRPVAISAVAVATVVVPLAFQLRAFPSALAAVVLLLGLFWPVARRLVGEALHLLHELRSGRLLKARP